MSMIFFSEWPFDNICPKFGIHLQRDIYQMSKMALNVSTSQVYEACDMNMISKLGEWSHVVTRSYT